MPAATNPKPNPKQRLKAKEAEFIEEAGVVYEQMGLPRMAGRILGWLLICDPPHQSLAELGEVLQASKGSISTMTRMLQQMEVIRRITLPGDRRDYVAIPHDAVTRSLSAQSARLAVIRRLAASGLEAIGGSRPERQARLRELHDFYLFLEREMPSLLERWEREQKGRGKRAK